MKLSRSVLRKMILESAHEILGKGDEDEMIPYDEDPTADEWYEHRRQIEQDADEEIPEGWYSAEHETFADYLYSLYADEDEEELSRRREEEDIDMEMKQMYGLSPALSGDL